MSNQPTAYPQQGVIVQPTGREDELCVSLGISLTESTFLDFVKKSEFEALMASFSPEPNQMLDITFFDEEGHPLGEAHVIKNRDDNGEVSFSPNLERDFSHKNALLSGLSVVDNKVNFIDVQKGIPFKQITKVFGHIEPERSTVPYQEGHSQSAINKEDHY